jgi:uncharacterized protein (DUF2147 family)
MALTVILAIAAVQAAAAATIQGQWRSPGGNSIIAIAPCGDSYCGTVAWASAKAKKDAAKTTQQLVGTPLLTNLTQGKDGRWQGKLFSPDKNMRVTAKIQPVGDTQLRVSGCLAGKSLCKSDLWTRADGPLPAPD